ncbi:MAG: DoxX family protein [Verrucomicrobia bacterium]|nr:DoxX family protein [Verrucomicrobiota bacterium]
MHLRQRLVRWGAGLSEIALAVVFIFAGAVKAVDPNAFAEQIMRYQLAPWPVAVVLALWLPFLEVAAGAGLFIPALRTGALAVITALLIAFTAALLSAWYRGLNIDCGCLGPALGPQSVAQALGRDGFLLLLLAGVWIDRARRRRTLPTPAGALSTSPGRISPQP